MKRRALPLTRELFPVTVLSQDWPEGSGLPEGRTRRLYLPPMPTCTGRWPTDEQTDPSHSGCEGRGPKPKSSEGRAGGGSSLCSRATGRVMSRPRLQGWCLRRLRLCDPRVPAALIRGGTPTVLLSFPWSQQEPHEITSHPSTGRKPRLGAGPRVHTQPQPLPQTQELQEWAVKPGQEGWAACTPAAAPHSERCGLVTLARPAPTCLRIRAQKSHPRRSPTQWGTGRCS